ncbi:type IV pilus assembly protein PilB [Sporomusaceae bacterium BoRhaA]|uniref:GspE/PulE family protein n=1 Tax=Pelorhabdus rhamnosifermentans TaxID=2772457 RepID=UPI001C064730|nr:GspE/PulE family protein [Pelorhabdus rhamnosifermentans]MBU2703052.1 type IV pilus assembly protein PilB [Pelorhabdus rhamnosifermentans]
MDNNRKCLGDLLLEVPHINLSSIDVPLEVASLIPISLAERYHVVPIRKEGKRLTLAMVDPTNMFAVDDVRLASGCHVDVVMASECDIKRTIEQSYGVHELVKKAVKQVIKEDSVSLVEVETSDDTPVISIVNSIISEAVKDLASDIHIEPLKNHVRVRYRIDGILRQVLELPLYLHAALISRIKIMSEMDIAEKRIPQDGRITMIEPDRQVDLRVSTLPTICGEKVAIRILDKAAIRLAIQELGFSKKNFFYYEKIYRQPYGIILITGPTGSGKTTTLYSTLTELSVPGKNVITVEDPVEYQLDGVNQVQVNPKAGLSFASGLRSILRQDPNIVMVGEIRDAETAELAIRAALTGHLVLSTLHTNDAPGAITRLIDMGVEPFLITASVLGVVAQRLVRSICPGCKKTYALKSGLREGLFPDRNLEENTILYKGEGCVRCGHTGYKGRIAVHEVMMISQEMREAIHRRASTDELAMIAVSQGMIRIREDGMSKALAGFTTVEEVMRLTFSES